MEEKTISTKELVNIEDKGEGNFVMNFEVKDKTMLSASVDDLRANKANYEEDIKELEESIADLRNSINESQSLIKTLEEKKADISKSIQMLDSVLVRYPMPVVENVDSQPPAEVNNQL